MTGEEQTDATGKYGMSGSQSKGSVRFWPTIFKVLELILAIICIGLIDDPANNSRIRVFVAQRSVSLAYATYGTFLILSAVYVLGKIVKDSWPWKTSALLSLIAASMYLACCATQLKDWADTKERNYWPPNTQRLDLLCACGFISLITCIVYIIDLILTLRAGSRGDMD